MSGPQTKLWVVRVAVLTAACLIAVGLHASGPGAVSVAVQNQAAPVVTLATSVRAVGPFTSSSPVGVEMKFGYDPADANHIYVFHNGSWHPIRIDTIQ